MQIEKLYEIFTQHPTVTTDTRQCTPGAMFFALKGETFDGNNPPVLPSQEATYNFAVNHQPKIEAANIRLEQSYRNVKASKSAWYPSLSLFAGYSTGYYNQ